MPFRCPSCNRPTLEIAKSVELTSDEYDELTLQTLKCAAWTCRFVGIAVYTESRRGSLGTESATHIGYTLSSKDVGKELGRIALLIKRDDFDGVDKITGKRFRMTLCE